MESAAPKPDHATEPDDGEVFRRRAVSMPVTICLLGMTSVFIAQAAAHDSYAGHLISVTMAIMSASVTVRAYRMATILVRPEVVVARAFVRTRRIPWDNIVQFLPQPRRDGFGRSGHTLAVQLSDGRVELLGEFFSPSNKRDTTNVETLAQVLNARRDAHAQGGEGRAGGSALIGTSAARAA